MLAVKYKQSVPIYIKTDCKTFAVRRHYLILNIAFVIPLKNLGILKITTFMSCSFLCETNMYHHLNKHRYPKISSRIVSIIAITAIGKNSPAATPIQKDSALKPAALAQPLQHKFIIFMTINSFHKTKFERKSLRLPLCSEWCCIQRFCLQNSPKATIGKADSVSYRPEQKVVRWAILFKLTLQS